MHTKRLFAIHGHHDGRGERGSFLSSSFISVWPQCKISLGPKCRHGMIKSEKYMPGNSSFLAEMQPVASCQCLWYSRNLRRHLKYNSVHYCPAQTGTDTAHLLWQYPPMLLVSVGSILCRAWPSMWDSHAVFSLVLWFWQVAWDWLYWSPCFLQAHAV